MKKATKVILYFVVVTVGTVVLSRWWYAHPDCFPISSSGFWVFADRLIGAETNDEAANVELLVTVTTAFISVAALTLIGVLLLGFVRRSA
jgi:hypothetical protein